MMYNEFIEGTGCKDNDHNYKVYKDLEIMYMNSDLTKQEIYEYGKKLVDNRKSQEQMMLENEIKEKLEETKRNIKGTKEEIEELERRIKVEEDTDWLQKWFDQKRRMKKVLDELKARKKELEWILNA